MENQRRWPPVPLRATVSLETMEPYWNLAEGAMLIISITLVGSHGLYPWTYEWCDASGSWMPVPVREGQWSWWSHTPGLFTFTSYQGCPWYALIHPQKLNSIALKDAPTMRWYCYFCIRASRSRPGQLRKFHPLSYPLQMSILNWCSKVVLKIKLFDVPLQHKYSICSKIY